MPDEDLLCRQPRKVQTRGRASGHPDQIRHPGSRRQVLGGHSQSHRGEGVCKECKGKIGGRNVEFSRVETRNCFICGGMDHPFTKEEFEKCSAKERHVQSVVFWAIIRALRGAEYLGLSTIFQRSPNLQDNLPRHLSSNISRTSQYIQGKWQGCFR